MSRLVWAFEPLDETGGETGFVEIEDEALAAKLIEEGKVQDGWEPEGGWLKNIDGGKVDAYATRQLKAGSTRPTRAPTEAPTPEEAPAPEAPTEAPAPPEEGKRGPGRPKGSTTKPDK